MKKEELELFIRYGSAASEVMTDFPCSFFRQSGYLGAIPYRKEHGSAIVFGDPLCPKHEQEELVKAFHAFCKEEKLNVIYMIVSKEFACLAKEHGSSVLIEACDEFIFNPQIDPCSISKRLQHRVEKAEKHGITVHEYLSHDSKIEEALKKIGMKWQQAIKGPHVYLGHLDFFENTFGKRWFYTEDGGEITAMAMLSRLDASNGWFLKFLTSLPNAFIDTSELLMNHVLKVLREENCHFLSKGMMPAEKLGEIVGLSPLRTKLFRGIYQLIRRIFKFDKRKEYWLRYHPQSIPSYILFTNPSIGINELRALKAVLRTKRV